QAFFGTLARIPGRTRGREPLQGWFAGGPYRPAMKAKRSAARRRNHETRFRRAEQRKLPGCSTRQLTLLGSPSWDDVQTVLDEEMQRLPESFRSAFLPCVLDGKTVPAAATEV